ncbi:uncharacterized protein M6B38_163255 [Iris pallida]|uniref:Uncharacterized protein n=1 Tax=Iris pallida TaxID=29817 RepID=A0AAX6F0T0_IRIPA|nr:uncharacterized protein M6B38_163255 [Iris pallida]
MLIITRTIPSSTKLCLASATADRFLSVPAAASCEMESPTWHTSIRGRTPPCPAIDRAVSADIESRCSDTTAFSLPTRLPDSVSLISGGRTPSDISRPSQFPVSASRQTTLAAFSLIFGAVAAASSWTRADMLLRPSRATTPFSSSLSASRSPSIARCLASLCPICSRASSSRTTSAESSGAAVVLAGGWFDSPSTPVLISSRQSCMHRSSFAAIASRSLCIRSLPTGGAEGPEQRSARSMVSETALETDWSCSTQRAFLAKKGWLERSERHGGMRSSLEAMELHRDTKLLADLALATAAGTSWRARPSQCSVEPDSCSTILYLLCRWCCSYCS